MVGTVDFVIETKATSDDHGRRALVYSTLHYHHNGILKQYVKAKAEECKQWQVLHMLPVISPKKVPHAAAILTEFLPLVTMQTEQISKSHEFSPL